MRLHSRCILALTLVAACTAPAPPSGEVNNPARGLWQDASVAPVRLTLEQTFADDESNPSGLLGAYFHVAVDDSGGVYALDVFGGRLVAYSPEGPLRWEVNAPGRGPGEINNPDPLLFAPPNTLVFGNQSGARVDRYDLEGNSLTSRTMASLGLGASPLLGILESKALLLRQGLPGSALAQVILVSDAATDSFVVDVSDGLAVPAGLRVPPRVVAYRDQVVASHHTNYGYSFYEVDGTLSRTVTRDVPIQAPIIRQITGGVQMQNWTRMYGPLSLPDGRWLGGGTWPTDMGDPEEYLRQRDLGLAPELTMSHTLDLFDPDGTLLYSLDAPALEMAGIQEVLATDSQGKLYARLSAGPYIGRFGVEIDPPVD